MSPGTVVALDGVAHRYGPTAALAEIDLRIDAGEVVAITGPSGGGKTTLLHVIAGLLSPDRGTVRTLGEPLAGPGAIDAAAASRLRRTRIGLVLQHGQLVPDLALRDNVALPLLLDGVSAGRARAEAVAALQRVDLAGLADAVPEDLSAGQQQVAAVARALVAAPELVLADEPTGSVDRVTGRMLLDLLLAEVRGCGAALVVTTHDNTVAARADRELRLVDGRVASDVAL